MAPDVGTDCPLEGPGHDALTRAADNLVEAIEEFDATKIDDTLKTLEAVADEWLPGWREDDA